MEVIRNGKPFTWAYGIKYFFGLRYASWTKKIIKKLRPTDRKKAKIETAMWLSRGDFLDIKLALIVTFLCFGLSNLGYNEIHIINQMRKQYGIIILFFILGITLCFLWNRPKANELRVVVVSVEEKTDTYTVHLEYPQFPGLPKDFNQKIKNSILEEVSDFKTTSKDNAEARLATAKSGEKATSDFSFMSGWEAEQINKSIVSFVLHTYFYTGGAHGGQGLSTFTYDIKNKKEVNLENLFGESKGYLEKISQFTMNDLKNQLRIVSGGEPNTDMLVEGTSPQAKNFERFTLGAGGTVTFYFEQYQVAPYVAGEQKVIMPLSYIKSER